MRPATSHRFTSLSCYNRRVSKDLRRLDFSGLRCHGARLTDFGSDFPELLEPRACVLVVSGRVQGVGFRWFAEREAVRRDVRGFVRNLEDGSVEIFAQADPSALEEFCECVRRGPAASRVERVEIRSVEVDAGLSSFRIRV
jgi:acylphosphatase